MSTSDKTQTNDLIYAAATVLTENPGVKTATNENKKDPWWKRRLEGQIQQLRRDLSRLQQLKEGKMTKTRHREDIQKKYQLREKGVKHVIEELKLGIIAKAAKVRRYKERIKQFKQNRLFKEDQSRFYQEINGEERSNEVPNKKKAKAFWNDIWSKEAKHNTSAEWIDNKR